MSLTCMLLCISFQSMSAGMSKEGHAVNSQQRYQQDLRRTPSVPGQGSIDWARLVSTFAASDSWWSIWLRIPCRCLKFDSQPPDPLKGLIPNSSAFSLATFRMRASERGAPCAFIYNQEATFHWCKPLCALTWYCVRRCRSGCRAIKIKQ